MSRRMPDYQRQLVRDLRQRQTETETLLWQELRNGKLDGLKFRRQRPLGRYIADFCCDAKKLVVEIDGAVHETQNQRDYDALRDEMMKVYDYTVLRIRADDVEASLETVLARIRVAATANATVTPSPLVGEGAGG